MHAHELWQKDYLIQDSEIVYGNVSSKKRIFNFSLRKFLKMPYAVGIAKWRRPWPALGCCARKKNTVTITS